MARNCPAILQRHLQGPAPCEPPAPRRSGPARLRTAPSRAVASARYAAAALALDGAAVIAGQAVAAADIGKLVFTPALNGNGTGYGDPTP